MSLQFNENLNAISGSDNLEIQLLDGDLNIIAKLDDEPNDVGGLTSAELKAKFDEAGNTIQKYINETLIPAVVADDATEAARAAAEQGRVTAEEGRVTAEQGRVEAENTRVSSETARESAETTRADNETARADAESKRANAESGRETAESGRVSAESGRVSAETGRVSAENVRTSAETERVRNESTRKSQEAQRQQAEAARVEAENGRVAAETDRKAFETQAEADEAARVTAEKGRVSAEKARASAETSRASAEQSRASAEEQRATNEGSRQTSEQGRVEAEQARVTAEGTRQTNESARQQGYTAMNKTVAEVGTDMAQFKVWETYSASKSYVPLNKVTYNGSSYICISAVEGVAPPNETYWQLIAAKGTDGEGSGDMLQADYDADGAVKNAGGIKAYADTKLALTGGTVTGDIVLNGTLYNENQNARVLVGGNTEAGSVLLLSESSNRTKLVQVLASALAGYGSIKVYDFDNHNYQNELKITPTETTIKNVVTPTANGDAVPKSYADAKLPKSGGTMTGNLNMGGKKLQNLPTPEADTDAAPKSYVDNNLKDRSKAVRGTYPVAAGQSIAVGDVVDVSGGQIYASASTSTQAIALTAASEGSLCDILFEGVAEAPGLTAGTNIKSDGVQGYVPQDGVLSTLPKWMWERLMGATSSFAHIETGSYVGVGIANSTNASLSFKKLPKLLIIISVGYQNSSSSPSYWFPAFGLIPVSSWAGNNLPCGFSLSTSDYSKPMGTRASLRFTVNANTVTWHVQSYVSDANNPKKDEACLNTSNTPYMYYAFY